MNTRLAAGIWTIILSVLSFLSASAQVQSNTFRTDDSISLHYYDAGNGPAIVLIPGWTMPAGIFKPQIDNLSRKFRVIALDLRSQGDSEKATDGNYPKRHAQDIEELLTHLQLQDVVLVGWSNGVPDVLTFINDKGISKLRGVVLVDGFLDVSSPQMQKAMAGMLTSFQADRAKFTDGFVRSMYSTKQSEEYIDHIKQESLKTPTNTAVTEMFNVLSIGNFTPMVAKISKPVLYVCEPQLQSQARLLQGLVPTARVEVFRNAGHAIFVDAAEQFNTLLSEFVASLPPISGQN